MTDQNAKIDGNSVRSLIAIDETTGEIRRLLVNAETGALLITGTVTGASIDNINDIGDVVIDGTPADNEVLAYDTSTSKFINQTSSEAGLAAASHNHAAGDITSDTFADARISSSSVLQHVDRSVQLVVVDFTDNVTTGDGKFYFHIDSRLNGMNLIDVHAEVITAGTTGTTEIQINNVTQTADMLSTVITIDSGETGSDTAETAAVIDTANDGVATNDLIRIDIDAVNTTAPKGLIVTLGFSLP